MAQPTFLYDCSFHLFFFWLPSLLFSWQIFYSLHVLWFLVVVLPSCTAIPREIWTQKLWPIWSTRRASSGHSTTHENQPDFEELTYLNCFASKTDHWQCCWHYWAAWTIHRSLNWTLLHSSYKLQEKIITICKIMFPFVQRHESSTPSLTWGLLSTWELVISPTISKSSWHMLLLDVHKTIDSDLGYSLGHKWWSITPIWVILLHSKQMLNTLTKRWQSVRII